MTNISNIPLEDGFKTSLSQTWTGGTGTVNVVGTPNFTFPAGITTYVVVNPGNTNMQIAEINAYSSGSKTLTVNNITLEKGASVNSTAQTHNVGSEVIISDNYQFWTDILTAVNTKVDGDVQGFPSYTTTNRDLISASNGMMVYNTTTGELNQYIGGAWSAVAAGSTQADASTTVAGKVEIATDAEVTAGTGTGGTGAVLSVTPTQANTLVNLATTDTTSSDTDFYMFEDAAASNINKKITQANLRDSLAASVTLKGTVELATDAEATTGTDTTRYINAKQLQASREFGINASTQDISLTTSLVIAHNLGKTPELVEISGWLNDKNVSEGSYDGTTNTSTAIGDAGFTLSNRTDLCIQLATGASAVLQGTATFDATNVTIAWSKVGSPTGTGYIRIKTV